MKLLLLTLTLSFSFACGLATKSPTLAPDRSSASEEPLELRIQPAVAAAPGGRRLPLQFTIHNAGDRAVHTCLAAGRVIHLWGLDRKYGYTLTQQESDQPACEEPIDLAPHADRSWTEEITIPAIAAGSARLVGFAQVVPPEPCIGNACKPVWLSATYAPFHIEAGPAQGPVLDLRTGAKAADFTASAAFADSGTER